MKTFTFNETELHEIVTALARNRAKIRGRLARTERLLLTPPIEEIEKQQSDPMRAKYLQTLIECRKARIEIIDRLLKEIE